MNGKDASVSCYDSSCKQVKAFVAVLMGSAIVVVVVVVAAAAVAAVVVVAAVAVVVFLGPAPSWWHPEADLCPPRPKVTARIALQILG